MINSNAHERYHRQVLLNEVGITGQEKLLAARVLVVGAGGLGCPVLQYLVAAGVGEIGIIDDDIVHISNLHRQVLYATEDIGKPKVECAAARLRLLNPAVSIRTFRERLTTTNIGIIQEYDIIIDGSDNFPTRYLVNDACVIFDKPLVYGAVSRLEGQVGVFNVGDIRCDYRDLFPLPPANGTILNCEEAGVLGVIPGIIGTMQALEAIKLITGMGRPLVNRLVTYRGLTGESFEWELLPRQQKTSIAPLSLEELRQTDYEWFCGITKDKGGYIEIDAIELQQYITKGSALIIDVREKGESPTVNTFEHLNIPLRELEANETGIDAEEIILFCQSGKRSRQAAVHLAERFGATKKIYSLKGGIIAWQQQS